MREGIGVLFLQIVLLVLIILASISYAFRLLCTELSRYDSDKVVLALKITRSFWTGETLDIVSIGEEMAKEEFYNCTKLGNFTECRLKS